MEATPPSDGSCLLGGGTRRGLGTEVLFVDPGGNMGENGTTNEDKTKCQAAGHA